MALYNLRYIYAVCIWHTLLNVKLLSPWVPLAAETTPGPGARGLVFQSASYLLISHHLLISHQRTADCSPVIPHKGHGGLSLSFPFQIRAWIRNPDQGIPGLKEPQRKTSYLRSERNSHGNYITADRRACRHDKIHSGQSDPQPSRRQWQEKKRNTATPAGARLWGQPPAQGSQLPDCADDYWLCGFGALI